ncbi:unnamed protein product, partial [marine sediment metagenome]
MATEAEAAPAIPTPFPSGALALRAEGKPSAGKYLRAS